MLTIIRMVSAALAIVHAIQYAKPQAGGSFSFPSFTTDAALKFYAPAALGLLNLLPFSLIGRRWERAGLGAYLAYRGFDQLVTQKATSFTMDNVVSGYAPAGLGGYLLYKSFF